MTIELFVFLAAFLVLTAIVSAEAEEMLSAVIALSIFGVMLAILFAVLQAPDVALTQAIINSGLVTSLFLVAYSQTGKKGDDPDRDAKP
nr:hydrogenase subunit MbhD domain-containing protein [uncultured Dethiosulfovibrio sp.]